METAASTTRSIAARAIHLVLIAAIALAFIGFFVGVDYGVPKPDETPIDRNVSTLGSPVIPAVSYSEVRKRPIGPNREWKSDLARIARAQPGVPEGSASIDPLVKLASLHMRSERRAYNGAPPIIPHAVDQMSSDNCLACHGEGLRIENRTANALPHPYYTNCQQCHAPAASSPFSTVLAVHNTFEGLPAPFEGPRAWPGAPPIVPHSTFMRDNCLACHGPTALPGLRTTHPERQQCLQCHAPSAELNQAVVAQSTLFLPAQWSDTSQ